jgi:hypothetical protein
VENIDAEFEFEKRMQNWRKTVRGFSGSGKGAMPGWAALYIKARDAAAAGVAEPFGHWNLKTSDDINHLDGWLIEATVRELTALNERTVLRCVYVYDLDDEQIRRKLGVRRLSVPLLLAMAKINLQKDLANKNRGTRIPINNLRAAVACP